MMNTPKTPEQIAHETLHALDFGHSDSNGDWIDPKERTIDPEDLPTFVGDAIRDGWFGGQDVVTWIVRAIEADRAQRDPNEDGTLHGAAILALRERMDDGNADRIGAAIELIENDPDGFWERYAGPMLDDMERDQEDGRYDA